MTEAHQELRYPKPKILLVDLPEEASVRLVSAGINVQAGTFGRPYRVPLGDNYLPVIGQPRLPNLTEQEVIIIDLTQPEPCDEAEGTPTVTAGQPAWYAKAGRGVIDPRPIIMEIVRDVWDRIFQSGGVFVVFVQPRAWQELIFGTVSYGRLEGDRTPVPDNWSFLSILSREHIKIDADHGTESQVSASSDALGKFLRSHQTKLEFRATVNPMFYMTYAGTQFDYSSIIENKFGQSIGGIITAKKPKRGRILILPQIKDKVRAVHELVTIILPELCRHLFPFFEGDRWIHSDEYEHASVLDRKSVQQKVCEEAEAGIAVLEKEIEAEQNRLKFLHGILTGTGDDLVADVQQTLAFIGFQKIETPPEEVGANKQEDLQIHDRSPVLLSEIKGIAGMPTEGDAIQCTKYVLRRMKLWKRTDVSGVFIVNHQRNMPALDRNHENVFTQQQLDDAAENGMGLTTTWDLFRLVRGMMQWNWPRKAVQDVFYGKGRLPSIPSHYLAVGKVAHYYTDKSVISIDVAGPGLRVGDTIGFLFPAGFYEEAILSLQVDKKRVTEATPGQRAGYKTTLERSDVPVGTPMFVVRPKAD